MNVNQLKKPYERAVKKSVSMPSILFDQANTRRELRRLTKFSDYVQELIRKDIEAGQQQQKAA